MGSALLSAGAGAALTLVLLALGAFLARAGRRPAPRRPAVSLDGGAGAGAVASPSTPAEAPAAERLPSTEAAETSGAGAGELPAAVRAIWESLLRGEVLLLPTAVLQEQPARVIVLALTAAQERWQADGTRAPCLLGAEELQLLHHRTPANLRDGKPGINITTLDKHQAELCRGFLRFVAVAPCATNRRGQGFATLLPCDPGQLSLSLRGSAVHAEPERRLRRPRGASALPRSGDLQVDTPRSPDLQIEEPRSPDLEREIPRSGDLAPPAPPVRKSVPSGSDQSNPPTSATARSPDPGAGPIGQPEEATREGGSVVELPAWPPGGCFQCWSPHLEAPEGPRTPSRREPALGMHGPKPPALDGLRLTETQLRTYCSPCLVRTATALRAQYGPDLEGLKNHAALVDRFLHDERQGRPWVVRRPKTGAAPAAVPRAAPPPRAAPAPEADEVLPAAPACTPEAAAVWEQVLPAVCQGQTGPEIDLWFRPLRCLSVDGGGVRLWAPNRFISQWVEDRHQDKILDALAAVLGERPTLTWEHGPTTQEGDPHAEVAS